MRRAPVESADSRLKPDRDQGPTRRRTVAYIAERWSDAGLDYGAVHGAEDFPDRLGRDLDVLVDRSDIELAAQIATKAMRELGWTVLPHRTPWGDVWLRGILVLPGRRFRVLEIDLLTRLRWACVPLAEVPVPESLCSMRGNIRIDPWAGFVKRVLLLVLSNRTDRLSSDPERLAIPADERRAVANGLMKILGSSGEKFLTAVDSRDVDWLRSQVPALRRAALRRALRGNPVKAAWLTGAWLVNEFKLHILPTRAVPVIAVVGPDGVGKSTTLRALAELLQTELRLPGVTVRHWRPEVLPPLNQLAGATPSVGEGRPPRRTAGKFPRIRLAYYALDHLLGYLAKDRILTSRAFAVCYDRCLLDMAVDPLRYGLASGHGVARMWRFLPKPDLLVLLTDEPHSIHDRKPELEESEIARQFQSWAVLVRRGDVHTSLQVCRSPEETARRLLELYVSSLSELSSSAR